MKTFLLTLFLILPAFAQTETGIVKREAPADAKTEKAQDWDLVRKEITADSIGMIQNRENLKLDQVKREILQAIDSTQAKK